jgi:hypothetical protein
MIGNLTYLYLISLLHRLFNALEEINEIAAYDLAKTFGDEVISLEEAIAEIDQRKHD